MGNTPTANLSQSTVDRIRAARAVGHIEEQILVDLETMRIATEDRLRSIIAERFSPHTTPIPSVDRIIAQWRAYAPIALTDADLALLRSPHCPESRELWGVFGLARNLLRVRTTLAEAKMAAKESAQCQFIRELSPRVDMWPSAIDGIRGWALPESGPHAWAVYWGDTDAFVA